MTLQPSHALRAPRSRFRRLGALVVAVALAATPSLAIAADIHVDAASGDDARSGASWAQSVRTIARGVAVARAAAGPDRILVAAGTYAENVVLDLVDTELLGGHPAGGGPRDPAANPTIIDGGAAGPALVISADGGLTPLAGIRVDGFTFRNGRQLGRANILGAGGGVFVEEAQVILTNNVITANVSDGVGLIGAGLYVFRSAAGASTITGNRFENNEARNGAGGAAAIVDDADPAASSPIDFSGNDVRNNRAISLPGVDPDAYSGLGGGLFTWNGRPRIAFNVIEGNVAEAQGSAAFAGQGGGIYVLDAAPIITSNTITANVARALDGDFGASGGGAYGWWSAGFDLGGAEMSFQGNTLAANRAEGGTGANQAAGGGIALAVSGAAHPVLEDNSFSDNVATGGGFGSAQGGAAFAYVDDAGPGGTTIRGGVVERNSAEAGGGGLWLQGGGAGRVVAEEILVRDNRADYGSGIMLFGDGTLRHLRVRQNRVYDPDGDQVSEISDNCPGLSNPVQSDADGDGDGDACDDDDDADGTPDASDACPLVAGASCAGDQDGDGEPDATDNCPQVANPLQEDATLDGVGDACEPAAFDALETNAGGVWVAGDGTLTNLEIVENFGQGLLIVGDPGGGGFPEDPASPIITNVTIAANQAAGFITYLANGTRFRDSIVARNLLSDGFDTERVGGVPSSPNVSCNDVYFWDGVASLPCTGTGNMDFTNGDAFFIAGPHGNHYLEQAAAGQARTFVGVDQGSMQVSASPVAGRTTRTDEVADSGTLDLGFHYSRQAPVVPPGPLDRAVRVTKTASAVQLSLNGVSPALAAARWYRGDLAILQAEYSHATPFTGTAGDPECSAAPTSLVADPGAWGDGNDYYYLAVPLEAGVEGGFGTSSLGTPRPRPEDSATDRVTNGCP